MGLRFSQPVVNELSRKTVSNRATANRFELIIEITLPDLGFSQKGIRELIPLECPVTINHNSCPAIITPDVGVGTLPLCLHVDCIRHFAVRHSKCGYPRRDSYRHNR